MFFSSLFEFCSLQQIIIEICIFGFLIWLLLLIYGMWPRTQTVIARRNSNDERSASFIQAFNEQSVGFLADKDIGRAIVYRVLMFLYYDIGCLFHRYTAEGWEKLDPNEGALVVGMHTTHNQDILMVQTGVFRAIGRAPRGALHRTLFAFLPWLRYVGMVPGQRNTVKHILKAGFILGLIPGGAEEAMSGHENAYKLHPRWLTRKGYAHVAQDAKVKIYPLFTRNAEEMRYNPIFHLWNSIGGGKLYDRLIKIPGFGSFFIKQCGLVTWFIISWISIPIPVKVTSYVGDAIEFDPERDTACQIADKTRIAFQSMIEKHQPHQHAYWPGIQERFGWGKFSNEEKSKSE